MTKFQPVVVGTNSDGTIDARSTSFLTTIRKYSRCVVVQLVGDGISGGTGKEGKVMSVGRSGKGRKWDRVVIVS